MKHLLWIGYPLLFIAVLHMVFALRLLLWNASRRSPAAVQAALLALTSGAYCLFTGISYIRASFGLSYDIYYRACWVGWVGIAPSILLPYYLTDRKGLGRLMGWLSYPIWIGFLILSLTTNWLEIGAVSLSPFVNRLGPYENAARVLGVLQLGWLMLLLFRIYRESGGIQRQKMGYLLLGLAIYGGGGAVISGIFQLLGTPMDPALSSYLSLPWIVLTFYAVTRYRLFDVRIILARVFSNFVLAALFTLITLCIFHALQDSIGVNAAIAVAVVSTALLGLSTPLVGFIPRAIRRMLLGQQYNYQRFLKLSSQSLIATLHMEDLLRRLFELCKESLGVRHAAFFLRNEAGEFRLGQIWEEQHSSVIKVPDELIDWLEKHQEVLIRDEQRYLMNQETFAPIEPFMAELRGEVVVPVLYQGALQGILILGQKGDRDAFHETDIDLLETLASQVAIALENIRLFREAITDGLTGLYHQKHFKDQLKAEIERCRRHDHTLVLLLLDVDHFKAINDTYGHLVGDTILRELAGELRSSFRVEDLVARYGGEEFAILLTESNPSAAIETAERLRAKVESRTFGPNLHITISIGLSSFDGSESERRDIEFNELTLIDWADEALYKAKSSGRNRVELVSRELPAVP